MAVASMAYDRGLYTSAWRNYRTALQAAEQLGFSEQQVLPILLGLTMCLGERGDFCEAEQLYKRIIQIDEAATSADCARLAIDLKSLALIYQKAGKIEQAQALLQKSLHFCEKGGSAVNHPID
jgi:tetratricopeptide (TPR) repeat protein